ncbi:MAG: formylglycine-generating enzyme family protein, partial [Planctomycetes bacterium]|nr:formylglycine-generating enzyme family protein [Planctomycetota bacterium]
MASRVVTGVVAVLAMVLLIQGSYSAAGERKKPQKEVTVDLGEGVTMKLLLIPAGKFVMGSPDSYEAARGREIPQHRVRITKPFYLGATEVTQGQYEKVMGGKPWSGESWVQEGPEYPATHVGWGDAQEFCQKLSSKEGHTYRLPTEAGWEYACRASSKTRYCFGDGESKLGNYAWYKENTWDIDQKCAHPVGLKRANAWGLYDMQANVAEWCLDRYGAYPGVVSDPSGPDAGSYRVPRGGAWLNGALHCRSAARGTNAPAHYSRNLGCRLALAATTVGFDTPALT